MKTNVMNSKENLVIDPVCGNVVNASSTTQTSQFKQETFYFCCGKCKQAFDLRPEKYFHSDNIGPFH